MVAEKKSVCFLAGAQVRIFFTSWMKPMSSIRSASSSTKISMPPTSMKPLVVQILQPAGVATRMSRPALMAPTWGFWPTPPKMTTLFRERWAPGKHSWIWMASSRVGEDQGADGPPPWGRRQGAVKNGRAKAQVLPVPVRARPVRPPASAAGWPVPDRCGGLIPLLLQSVQDGTCAGPMLRISMISFLFFQRRSA